MRVRFIRYRKDRLNGEYATRKSPCYTFVIMLNGFKVQEFSQYVPFVCYVDKYDETLKEASKYLKRFCKALKVDIPDMEEKDRNN